GDPRLCTRLGDTPSCTGLRDGADATLPWWNPGFAPTLGPVRASDGTALSMTVHAPAGAVEPPWMTIAEDEARTFKGETEAKIEKTRNYATAVGTGQSTIVGNDHPWCAAFVNYCLQKAGVDIENPTFADHVASKGRAHGFFEVKGEKLKKGADKALPMVRNPHFELIDTPVFGAIAMVTASSGHGHHVGFVYSQPRANFVVLLGGNQDDRICFEEFNVTAGKGMKNHLMFFVPGGEKWAPMTKTPLGDEGFEALNKAYGIVLGKVKKAGATL
ncbi:MAG: hypothetical protein ABJD97_10250, partial [Betaproteobacteria bacterium]